MFAVTPGSAWLHGGSLELCDPLADDPLLAASRRQRRSAVPCCNHYGRKGGWLLEVANIDTCSLMVKYGDGKNYYNYNIHIYR